MYFSQVITNYDFDKDGKLNMAEYKQYLTESEEGDGMEVKKEDNEEKRKHVIVWIVLLLYGMFCYCMVWFVIVWYEGIEAPICQVRHQPVILARASSL